MGLFTINIKADLHDAKQIDRIEAKVDGLVAQGVKLMSANAQILQFLSELKVYTDEIAADIDKLIADNELSPEVTAALQAHSATLKAIAAKNDTPLPPPVEPTT